MDAVVEQSGQKGKSGWVTYKTLLGEYSENEIQCMLNLGTIQTTPDPALAGGSVEWPRNLLFFRSKVTIIDNKVKEKRAEVTRTSDIDEAEAVDIQEAMARAIPKPTSAPPPPPPKALVGIVQVGGGLGSGGQGSPRVGGAGSELGDGGKQNPILSQLRSAHNTFDKKKRDFLTLIKRSKGCPMTCGTPMESKLVENVDAAALTDDLLLNFEIQRFDVVLSVEDELLATQKIALLIGQVKKAQQYANAIKSLLKVEIAVQAETP